MGRSFCACAQNLALSENRRKGALGCTGGRRWGGRSFCFLMPTLNTVSRLYRQILSDLNIMMSACPATATQNLLLFPNLKSFVNKEVVEERIDACGNIWYLLYENKFSINKMAWVPRVQLHLLNSNKIIHPADNKFGSFFNVPDE